MATDLRQPATLGKPPELATRPTLAALLGRKACGVMVWCDSVPPNVKVSDGSQPPMTFDLSLSESAGSRSLHRLVR
jgi:hypothetical protein